LIFGVLEGVALAGLLLAGVPALADDKAELEQTRIIGNRELPKVLVIVPWKKPPPGEGQGRPRRSVMDEALAPLDAEVFAREVRYAARAAQAEPSREQGGEPAGMQPSPAPQGAAGSQGQAR
jgi:hypothetical protein